MYLVSFLVSIEYDWQAQRTPATHHKDMDKQDAMAIGQLDKRDRVLGSAFCELGLPLDIKSNRSMQPSALSVSVCRSPKLV